MEDKSRELEKNQQEKPLSLIPMAIITGLFGGLFWSALAYLAYAFHMTDIPPNIILEPWALGDWKKGWLGMAVSIIVIGCLAIIPALIYYAAFRNFKSIWAGAGYGVVLFLLVFIVLNPMFPGIDPFGELKRNTVITSVCFYILFGVFIGYSISYEAAEIQKTVKKEKEAKT